MQLNSRQLGTVLAALRLWQQSRPSNPDLRDIATDFGAFQALDVYEIDELCEDLNFAPTVDEE
jgi:hypothetical protein